MISVAACGGSFNSNSGTISSPNFPNDYNNNDLCNYNIYAAANSITTFIFYAFTTEFCCDRVQVWQFYSLNSDNILNDTNEIINAQCDCSSAL